ncbi:Tyrosine recombinase Tlet_1492 [Geodia barretti]|uniref:Tyrosine recombinase Tlet_1492 n=1 Tax=Geodia barretti TaxID=519541 RepID=A0AA35X2Z6_GEOBA|nr:Tyrosine recombinase Tlet_1492 [Geodia barretti]
MSRFSRPAKATPPFNAKRFIKYSMMCLSQQGLNGKLATHTLRKTFAQRLYQQCNDIYLVRELLGHKNVVTTQAYIGINYVSAQDAVEAMSLDAEDTPRDPLDAFPPEQLIAKVIALGYEVRLRTEK